MTGNKILIITREIVPFYYGGIGTQFKALANLLQRHGHTVLFLSERLHRFDREIFRKHYGNAMIDFIDPYESSVALPRPLAFASAVGLEFDRRYMSLKPDIVISADFEAEGLIPLLKSHRKEYEGTRFILTINGLTVQVSLSQEEWMTKEDRAVQQTPFIRMLHAMEKLCILSAGTVVAPTALIWEETQDLLGIKKMSRIIPNLADDDFFQGGDLRQGSSNHGGKEKYLLFIGRLEHRKGPDLLLEAYLFLSRAGAQNLPKIIFIGGDCYWKEYGATFLQHWLPSLGGADRQRITFTGQIDHELVGEYLHNAALCIFPSRWEPFGIVCLEAMAAGCPVIVSAGTGLQEVIGSSLAEYAVDLSAGPISLAEKIQSVLQTQPDDLNDRLRGRSRTLMHQAETAWLELISGTEARVVASSDLTPSWSDATEQLLLSLSQSEPEQADRLKFYFRRKGQYSEAVSVNRIFPRYRWMAMTVSLCEGTGEEPLRIDPAERPGLVLLKELIIRNEQGIEIWRCDSTTEFSGLTAGGEDVAYRSGIYLVIPASTEDPQLFVHCPAVDEPVVVTVNFYVGDDIGFMQLPLAEVNKP
ncbi:MAG: glycosyltransferase family 4 protein [Chloroflexi bacterium]|nr:glycosyltransferase family 4 protein [Chloroflexota bacterium]